MTSRLPQILLVALALALLPACAATKKATNSIFGEDTNRTAQIDVPYNDETVPVKITASSSSGPAFEGVGHIRNSDWAEAIKSLEQAVKDNPNDYASHFNLGVAYEMSGDLASADKNYKMVNMYKSDEQSQAAVRRVSAKLGRH